MATAAKQLHGSVLAPPNRRVATSAVRFSSPLLPPRVSSSSSSSALSGYSPFVVPKWQIPTSTFAKRNRLTTIAFDADTSVKYTADETPDLDSKSTEEDAAQDVAILASTVGETDQTALDKEDSSPPKKNYAKIHDFCLGIPFGGFLLAMGIIGFLIWRNLESLFLGIAPGAAIFVLGITSLKVWRGGKSSVPFILAQAAIASVLVWKFIQAYNLTKKLLPWGFYSFVSAAMICFYLYVMVSGGNPPPKKKAVAPS